jgi:thiol-disulfide isomerase/thioredoxin
VPDAGLTEPTSAAVRRLVPSSCLANGPRNPRRAACPQAGVTIVFSNLLPDGTVYNGAVGTRPPEVIMRVRVVAAAVIALITIGTGAANAQEEHVGKLNRSLQPTGGSPDCILLAAKPEDVRRLPSAVRSGKVMVGLFPAPWMATGIPVALVEAVPGGPAVYADLDGNGRWTDGERLVSAPRLLSGPADLPSEEFVYQLPLPATSPWRFLPLVVIPGWAKFPRTGTPDVIRLCSGGYIEGEVRIDGTGVLVRLRDNVDTLTGTVNATRGMVEMDTNGDGKIDGRNESPEIDWPKGEVAIFLVGTHYLSVKSVDVRAGTLTLREHPPSDYTRIRFELGLEVPDFSFVDFQGSARRLSEFRGKYLLLEFWGTWCSGCISDMPGLVEVYREYRGRGFEILGMDDELTLRAVPPKNPDEMTAKARALVAEKGVTWPQVRTETAEVISRRFRIGVHPTYILLDPMGRIVSWEGGGQPTLRGPKLRDTLERLLTVR